MSEEIISVQQVEYDYQLNEEFENGRYVLIGNLSQGGYGKTFLVHDKQSNSKRAMKSIFNFDLNRDTLREIEIMKGIRHENIMKYYDSFKTKKIIYNLIIEYCDGGDLAYTIQRYKNENRVIPRQRISQWNKQILTGLNYLHSLNLIHRDIKPDNIFLDRLATLVKIANLDFARDPNSLAINNDEFSGTTSYMSPQMVQQDTYTSKTDIWSFGCIVYELLTLRKAFNGKTVFDVMDSIMKNKPKPIDCADIEFEYMINK